MKENHEVRRGIHEEQSNATLQRESRDESNQQVVLFHGRSIVRASSIAGRYNARLQIHGTYGQRQFVTA
jgi:hypothetical protein